MGQQADVVWVGNPHPAVVTELGHEALAIESVTDQLHDGGES